MTPTAVAAAQTAGATIVDVRPVGAFAAGHPTGALSIPLRPAFASWLGWLARHDRPLVLVRDADQDVDEVLWQAAKAPSVSGGASLGQGPGPRGTWNDCRAGCVTSTQWSIPHWRRIGAHRHRGRCAGRS